MKEDTIIEEANNIDLEPVMSPSNEIQSPHLAPEQRDEADVHSVRILRTITEHRTEHRTEHQVLFLPH